MKDSGIPWLGEIPEHWDICFFKRLVRIYNGSDYKHIQVDEGGFPVIGSGGEFARASDFLYDGEAIFIGRKGTIDKPFYFRGKFWAIDTIFYCVPHNNATGKYFYFQATTFPYERYITSTAKPSLTQTDLGDFIVVNPPIPEQKAIAEYLDKRRAEIDELISVEERMIAGLNTYKQSIIAETITRKFTLNGDLLNEWKAYKMKYLVDVIGGVSYDEKDLCSQGIRILRGGNIQNGRIKLYSDDIFLNSSYYDRKNSVRKGDIVFVASTGSTDALGKTGFCNEDLEHTQIGAFLRIIRPKGTVYAPFLNYLFLSGIIKRHIEKMSAGTNINNVRKEYIADFVVSLPPLSEQQAIVEYLDKRCAEVDSLVALKQQKIDKLKEYKQSVIYEYVTGKKEIH